MPFDLLETIETDLLAANSDQVIPLPPVLEAAPDVAIDDIAPAEPQLDLMDIGTFHGQFCLIHDAMGGMVQMRTGSPCPLGDAARGEGGKAASGAIYELASQNPVLAKMLLSTQSTFVGQLMAIGLHGANCVQIVKASQAAAHLEHEVIPEND